MDVKNIIKNIWTKNEYVELGSILICTISLTLITIKTIYQNNPNNCFVF